MTKICKFFFFAILMLVSVFESNYCQAQPGQIDQDDLQRQVQDLKEMLKQAGPQFTLVGKLERGSDTKYSINGEDFSLNNKTRVNGKPAVGKFAEVRGSITDNGAKIAKSLVVGEKEFSLKVKPEQNLDGPGPSRAPAGLTR